MTRISIDDSLTESNRWEPAESVQDVINAVVSDLPPNRIVTSISIDGQAIPRQKNGQTLKARLELIRDLQIRTADALVFATNAIDRATNDIERLQKSLLMAAELFRDDRHMEGSRIFLRCVEGLESFLDTIVISRLAMKLDFQKIAVDGIPLARLENDFSVILRKIVSCQEQKDFDGVADKVEYELLPCFSSWSRALRQLQVSLSDY